MAGSWSTCELDGLSGRACGLSAGLLKGRALVNRLRGIASLESGQRPVLLKPLVKCRGRND